MANVFFSSKDLLNEIQLQNNNKAIRHINISNIVLKDERNIDFKYAEINKPLSFVDCEFRVALNFHNYYFNTIIINNCIGKDLNFSGSTKSLDLLIQKSNFENIYIGNCNIQSLRIKDSNSKSVIVNSVKVANQIEVIGKSNMTIDNIEIKLDNPVPIVISRIKISRLLTGTMAGSDFLLDNCYVNYLQLNDSNNIGNYRIVNLIPISKDSELDFSKGKIKCLQFENCNFNNFGKIKFRGHQGYLKVDKIKWKILISDNYSSSTDEHRYIKERMNVQGNRVDAIFFQAYELEAYRRSLGGSDKYTDRFILFIYSFSNFYRLKLWLPVFWYIVFGCLFFYLIIWNENIPLKDNWGYLFSFLNPVHSPDFLGKLLKNWSLFFDFAGRLFLSFFIYQFIQSFRRLSLN